LRCVRFFKSVNADRQKRGDINLKVNKSKYKRTDKQTSKFITNCKAKQSKAYSTVPTPVRYAAVSQGWETKQTYIQAYKTKSTGPPLVRHAAVVTGKGKPYKRPSKHTKIISKIFLSPPLVVLHAAVSQVRGGKHNQTYKQTNKQNIQDIFHGPHSRKIRSRVTWERETLLPYKTYQDKTRQILNGPPLLSRTSRSRVIGRGGETRLQKQKSIPTTKYYKSLIFRTTRSRVSRKPGRELSLSLSIKARFILYDQARKTYSTSTTT
jgi:hypothetical protein